VLYLCTVPVQFRSVSMLRILMMKLFCGATDECGVYRAWNLCPCMVLMSPSSHTSSIENLTYIIALHFSDVIEKVVMEFRTQRSSDNFLTSLCSGWLLKGYVSQFHLNRQPHFVKLHPSPGLPRNRRLRLRSLR